MNSVGSSGVHADSRSITAMHSLKPSDRRGRSARSHASRWCALSVVLLFLVPTSSFGQYLLNEAPKESPYWWTLTDSVSPADLQKALTDRGAMRERLEKAIAEDRHPAQAEAKLERLSFHVDAEANPELVPMWNAFDAYAPRWEYRPNWETTAVQLLAEYGVSSEGIETIVDLAAEHREREHELQEQLGPHQRELVALLRDAERRIGRSGVSAAQKSRDFVGLARAAGRSPQEVERVYKAAQGDPSVIAGIESVVKLRDRLSGDDWNAFRRYLLEDVAPQLGLTMYDEEG